jgi:hypothetical protein
MKPLTPPSALVIALLPATMPPACAAPCCCSRLRVVAPVVMAAMPDAGGAVLAHLHQILP